MLYTILEVAKITKLSKVTVYKKLKLKTMKEHTSIRQGKTCIDEEGLKLIQDSLQDLNEKTCNATLNDKSEPVEPTTLNKDMFKALTDQLKIKDTQIYELNERLKQSLKLNENAQVLLQDKPKLLEEPKESFWKKFFS